jgi:hypothetical protein
VVLAPLCSYPLAAQQRAAPLVPPSAASARLAPVPMHRPLAPAPAAPLVGGGLFGGAAGAAAGAFAGVLVSGNLCDEPGDPDACNPMGAALLGAAVGHTLLAPAGVHLANRRRGDLSRSLVASAVIGAAGIGSLLLLEQGVRRRDPVPTAVRSATIAIGLAIPVAQRVTAIALERRSSTAVP